MSAVTTPGSLRASRLCSMPATMLLMVLLICDGAEAYVGGGGDYAAMIYVIALIVGLIAAVGIVFAIYFFCFRPYINREHDKSVRGSAPNLSQVNRSGITMRHDPFKSANVGGGNKRYSDPIFVENYRQEVNHPFRSTPAIYQAQPRYDQLPINQIGAQMGVNPNTSHNYSYAESTGPMQDELMQNQSMVQTQYMNAPFDRNVYNTATHYTTTTTQAAFTGSSV